MDPVFFYEGWRPIARILLVGTLGFTTLVLLIRISGKRSLAQMNPFDFVITVALGASFGRIITAQEVGLVEAVVTFTLLVTLQLVYTTALIRVPGFGSLVTSRPRLVYFRGEILHDALARERVTEAELHSAVRSQGAGSLSEVEAVVFESDGSLAVIKSSSAGDGSSIERVISRRG